MVTTQPIKSLRESQLRRFAAWSLSFQDFSLPVSLIPSYIFVSSIFVMEFSDLPDELMSVIAENMELPELAAFCKVLPSLRNTMRNIKLCVLVDL